MNQNPSIYKTYEEFICYSSITEQPVLSATFIKHLYIYCVYKYLCTICINTINGTIDITFSESFVFYQDEFFIATSKFSYPVTKKNNRQ